MFFSDKKVIGLDIGTSTIKVAELDVSKSGIELQAFATMQTPQNLVTGGEINSPADIGAIVRSLVSEMRSKRKNVCAGLWGMAVIVKKISIPRIEPKLIKDQLRFEAEQYIPFDINNIVLSHHVLQTSSSPDTMDILLVAAQNELVGKYASCIESAGLKTEILDVSGFALANCFEANYGRLPGQNIGLFNVGASVTNFVVISNGEVIFVRDVPAGGMNHTLEIHKAMGISSAEAESLKISASTRRDVPEEVLSIISSTNESIGEEIRNSLEFLNATAGGINLNRCFMTGGASVTPGIGEAISRVTGVGVELFNPLGRILVNPKRVPSHLLGQIGSIGAIAMGLGMREGSDT